MLEMQLFYALLLTENDHGTSTYREIMPPLLPNDVRSDTGTPTLTPLVIVKDTNTAFRLK